MKYSLKLLITVIFFALFFFPIILFSVEFTVPFQSYSADIADIDADGDLDVIVGSLVPGTPEPPDSITILLNNGYGEFTKTIIPKNNYSYIKAVDIDCDGLLDLCTKNSPDYQLVYYKNLDNLQFDEATVIPVQYTYVFQRPKFCDIENDGDMDIVINHCGEDGACNILINDGSGSFDEENAFFNEDGIVYFDFGDINEDDFSDIIITTHLKPYLYINDNFNFIPTQIDTIHWGKPCILDMNDDEYTDLVLNNDLPSFTKILYNDGAGNFYDEHIIEMPFNNKVRNINDYNNDGFPDFAIQTYTEPPNVYICFNNGDGTISDPVAYTFGSVYSFVVRSADFDGNEYNDLVVTGYYHSGNSHGVSILFNDGTGNFVDEPVVGINDECLIEKGNCILTNYPNPFNPATTISYNLPLDFDNAIIEIFDIKGRKVKTFNITNRSCKGSFIWDGTDKYQNKMPSSVYLLSIKADRFISEYKKMIMIK